VNSKCSRRPSSRYVSDMSQICIRHARAACVCLKLSRWTARTDRSSSSEVAAEQRSSGSVIVGAVVVLYVTAVVVVVF
jgi:hypothetical protein